MAAEHGKCKGRERDSHSTGEQQDQGRLHGSHCVHPSDQAGKGCVHRGSCKCRQVCLLEASLGSDMLLELQQSLHKRNSSVFQQAYEMTAL